MNELKKITGRLEHHGAQAMVQAFMDMQSVGVEPSRARFLIFRKLALLACAAGMHDVPASELTAVAENLSKELLWVCEATCRSQLMDRAATATASGHRQ